MKKFTLTDAAMILIGLLPVFYLAFAYPLLPKTVPLHYGMDSLPDRYGNKSELFAVFFILLFITPCFIAIQVSAAYRS